jgi:hydrogenase-1 operon protein HyaF
MHTLADIAIITTTRDVDDTISPPLLALLHELHALLQSLQSNGTLGVIDLRSLPLFPGDAQRLQALLGEGEVNATLTALGRSTIRESSIAGIWWVTHYNTADEKIAEYLEITTLPELLQTPQEELSPATQALQELINSLSIQSDT